MDNTSSPPVLLLNSGVPKAQPILNSKGTHGAKARVRDATFYLIAHQVWSSFLSYILTRLSLTDGNGGDQPDPSEILEEWERGAVLDWGKYLAPGVPNEDILRTLQERYRDLQRLQTLMVRQPPNIIQERLQTFLGFEGLAKELVTGES